jgi:enolase
MSSAYEIEHISGMEILDSRGNPTLQAQVQLKGGAQGIAMVPSGASVGSFEAVELRDNEKRYGGKGVLRAVEHVNQELNQLLQGQSANEQRDLDRQMCQLDGSADKSRLGANAILGVSIALARAVAAQKKQPLYAYIAELHGSTELSMPVPMLNVLNGGAHASNNIDLQEFMVQPVGASNFCEALQWGTEIYHALRTWLKKRGHTVAVGDEGGFAPNLSSNEQALEALVDSTHMAGFKMPAQIRLCMDCAATEFYKKGQYCLDGEKQQYTAEQFADYLMGLRARFPISSIEDGMAEEDWQGWSAHSMKTGKDTQLVGDDLFVTSMSRLERGIEEHIANAILIKLNQIGTLSETLDVIARAQKAGYGVVISHRSGETEDTTIADLAVGTAAGQIKTGAPCRSDRVAKYNRLLTIEAGAGDAIPYNGRIDQLN